MLFNPEKVLFYEVGNFLICNSVLLADFSKSIEKVTLTLTYNNYVEESGNDLELILLTRL